MSARQTKTVTMTVYRIEADLLETTRFSDAESSYLLGRIRIHARAGGRDHSWQELTDKRWWPGDTINVVVEVDE